MTRAHSFDRYLLSLWVLLVVGCHSPAPYGTSPKVQGPNCPSGVCVLAEDENSLGTLEVPRLLSDLSGESHDLHALLRRGPVVLSFWQTWCKSCLREAPALSAAERAYGEKLQFLGVISGTDDVVDEAKVKRLADRFALSFPQIRDRDLRLARHFQVAGTPTVVILGPDGGVRYKGHRTPESWSRFIEPSREE